MAKWVKQWNRVLRWERRVREYVVEPVGDEPFAVGRDEEELSDFVHSAFVATYHLKDHLFRDEESRSAVRTANLEGFIDSSDPLAYCADLANAYKHLILDWGRPRRSSEVQMTPQITVAVEGEQVEVTGLSLDMKIAGRSVDPVNLLTESVLDWEFFLVEQAHVLREDWRVSSFWSSGLPAARPPVPAARD